MCLTSCWVCVISSRLTRPSECVVLCCFLLFCVALCCVMLVWAALGCLGLFEAVLGRFVLFMLFCIVLCCSFVAFCLSTLAPEHMEQPQHVFYRNGCRTHPILNSFFLHAIISYTEQPTQILSHLLVLVSTLLRLLTPLSTCGCISPFLLFSARPAFRLALPSCRFWSFCKVGSGYSLEELAQIREKLQPHWQRWNPRKVPAFFQG